MLRKMWFLMLIAPLVFLVTGCGKDVSRDIVMNPVEVSEHGNSLDLVGVGDSLSGPSVDEPYANSPINADSLNALARALVQQGSSAPGESQPKQMGWQLYIPIPFYSQRDPRWSSKYLGFGYCRSTIGDQGCHLSCVSMLYAYWGYSWPNPPNLNDWVYNGIQHYAFSSSGCGDLIRPPEALQYPNMCRPIRYISANEVYGQVQRGRPIVVHTNQYGSHFVLIFGFDGQRYWVKDPLQDAAHQDQPLSGAAYSYRLYGYN